MAIALAAAAALVNALTSVFQRIGVESAPSSASMRLSLMAHALRRGIWLAGFGLMLVSGALLAVALRFGDLSVVQPVAATEVLFLVGILGVAFHYPVQLREWTGSALVVVGLGLFFVVADPTGGRRLPSGAQWLVVSAIIAGTVLAAVAAARYGPRWWRAASFGLAAAIALAYNAALTKATTTYVTEGWGHVFDHWPPYGIAVTGVLGLFLLQNALHAGPITASRTTTITANPLVSIALGLTLFGDRLRSGGPAIPLECLGLAVLVAGIALLAQSPLVAGKGDGSGPGELLADARRTHRAPSGVDLPGVDLPGVDPAAPEPTRPSPSRTSPTPTG